MQLCASARASSSTQDKYPEQNQFTSAERAFANLFKSTVGVGIFFLPGAMRYTGWLVGSVILAIVGCMGLWVTTCLVNAHVFYATHMIAGEGDEGADSGSGYGEKNLQCNVGRRTDDVEHHTRTSPPLHTIHPHFHQLRSTVQRARNETAYAAICRIALGKPWSHSTAVCLTLYNLSGVVVYLQLAAGYICEVVDDPSLFPAMIYVGIAFVYPFMLLSGRMATLGIPSAVASFLWFVVAFWILRPLWQQITTPPVVLYDEIMTQVSADTVSRFVGNNVSRVPPSLSAYVSSLMPVRLYPASTMVAVALSHTAQATLLHWMSFLGTNIATASNSPLVLPLHDSMHTDYHGRPFLSLYAFTTCFITLLSIFYGFIGYCAYGTALQHASLLNLIPIAGAGKALRIILCVSLILTCPILYVPPIETVDRFFGVKAFLPRKVTSKMTQQDSASCDVMEEEQHNSSRHDRRDIVIGIILRLVMSIATAEFIVVTGKDAAGLIVAGAGATVCNWVNIVSPMCIDIVYRREKAYYEKLVRSATSSSFDVTTSYPSNLSRSYESSSRRKSGGSYSYANLAGVGRREDSSLSEDSSCELLGRSKNSTSPVNSRRSVSPKQTQYKADAAQPSYNRNDHLKLTSLIVPHGLQDICCMLYIVVGLVLMGFGILDTYNRIYQYLQGYK